MTSTEIMIAFAFVIIGAVLFYLSNIFRQQRIVTIFELIFMFGNLFILTALWIVYTVLTAEYPTLSDVGFAMFNAFLWFYFILITVIMLKTLYSMYILIMGIVDGVGK